MPRARISVADKQRLLLSYDNGEDYLQLAQQLNINRATAYSIVRRALNNNRQVARQRGGHRAQRQRLNQVIINAATDIVEHHPEYTLDRINAEIRLRVPQENHISRSTLARGLDGALIVLKKLEDAPQERNSERVKESRFQFAQWILQLVNAELIFIDEAGINLWCRRTRGRAPVGQRAVRVIQGRRGPNLTMTFAVSSVNGILHHNLQRGGMNNERFIDFLQNLNQRLPNDGQHRVFIYDNAPAHRAANRANLNANIELRALPPYSPMLNIVENCISQWKAAVKRDLADTRDDILVMDNEMRLAALSQIAEQNANVVTPENAANYFRRMQAYLPRCMVRDNILM